MPRPKKQAVQNSNQTSNKTVFDVIYFAGLVRDKYEANALHKKGKIKVNGKLADPKSSIDPFKGVMNVEVDGQTREIFVPDTWRYE